MTRPGLLLTGRDRAVLHSLRDMRCLTIEQVQRLHFPSLATARRRIRLLEQAGLVVRFRSPAVAVELIRPMRAGPLHDSPRRARPSALFLEHALAINDFRIAVLRSLDLRGDLVLTGFACDRDRVAVGRGQRPRPVLATLAAGSGSSARHLPDGAFVLRRGERSALFVLEIDRGTEVVGRSGRGVDKMIRAYLSAIASGVLLELAPALGVPATPALCRVLIVTTSQARVEHIRRRWGCEPFEPDVAKRLVWITDRDMLRSADVLGAPWHSIDAADDTVYRIDNHAPEVPA